jgi:hypothetical protein
MRKQCSSGLHIWIRNCNRYSCAHINGHSKNFSNPQVAKVARTPGPSMAMTSRNWAQSRSRHRTGIITTVHLQTTQSPISVNAAINNIKKTHFFTLQPCHLGAVFVTHRRTHMRACSLHRHAYMHACSLHRRAYMRTCALHRCVSVRTCLLHRRTPTHACSPYRRAQVRAYQTHRHACSTHRRTLQACLKFSLSRTHARIFCVQARTYARLSPNRPRMWGPRPLNTPVRPSVQTLPKN